MGNGVPLHVQLIPGTREKGTDKDFFQPYREPFQVPLPEKGKVCWEKSAQGIRQISPVPSEEGVPAALAKPEPVGRSDKGGPTV